VTSKLANGQHFLSFAMKRATASKESGANRNAMPLGSSWRSAANSRSSWLASVKC